MRVWKVCWGVGRGVEKCVRVRGKVRVDVRKCGRNWVTRRPNLNSPVISPDFECPDSFSNVPFFIIFAFSVRT